MPWTKKTLIEAWVRAKEAEAKAQEERREFEDAITELYGIPMDWEGSKTLHEEGFKVCLGRKLTRKVEDEHLQELAKKHGLESLLPVLFRWKPEINAKEWGKAPEEVARIFSQAITTKPGRVSYKIEREEI